MNDLLSDLLRELKRLRKVGDHVLPMDLATRFQLPIERVREVAETNGLHCVLVDKARHVSLTVPESAYWPEGTLRLWCLLDMYAVDGVCSTPLRELADIAGWSVRSLERRLRDLVDVGAVVELRTGGTYSQPPRTHRRTVLPTSSMTAAFMSWHRGLACRKYHSHQKRCGIQRCADPSCTRLAMERRPPWRSTGKWCQTHKVKHRADLAWMHPLIVAARKIYKAEGRTLNSAELLRVETIAGARRFTDYRRGKKISTPGSIEVLVREGLLSETWRKYDAEFRREHVDGGEYGEESEDDETTDEAVDG